MIFGIVKLPLLCWRTDPGPAAGETPDQSGLVLSFGQCNGWSCRGGCVHDEHHRHEHRPSDPPGEPHSHRHINVRLRHKHLVIRMRITGTGTNDWRGHAEPLWPSTLYTAPREQPILFAISVAPTPCRWRLMILAWSRVTGRWRDGLPLHSVDIDLWETRFWSLDDNAHHLASFSDKVFLSLKDIVFCPWTTSVFDHAFENADERLDRY